MGFARWSLAVCMAASAALAITPEQLIRAPRRSEAVPNASGVALFSTSRDSFEEHASTSWGSLLDLRTGEVRLLTNGRNVSEIVWLGPTDPGVLYINAANADIPGGVELWVSDVTDFANAYKAGCLPAPLSGLKAVQTTAGDIHGVLSGKSHANGTAYNEKLVTAPRSSARVYDSIYVRHWDSWLAPEFNAVFSGVRKQKSTGHGHGESATYSLEGGLQNLVSSIKNAESPYPPFGGSSDYDISPDGKWVAFKSKAPELPEANYTTSYIYLVPHGGSAKPFAINAKKIAYFQMEEDNYESDRRVLYVYTIGSEETISSWTADGQTFIVSSEDRGRVRLFSLPTNAGPDDVPQNFTGGGAVSAFHLLPDSTVLRGLIKTLFSANDVDPESSGLSPADIDECYYEGNWTDIHSWIVYPKDSSKNKPYPLLLYIHGGPQGSFADQGYVVIAPNPTGSSGFGEKLQDAVQNDWGGAPYDDLVKAWAYVDSNLDFVDTANGVAAGASYGGFMINWIQGNDLGRTFKALVSHDGTFVADAKISTEELWFMQHDFNGTFWDARDNFRRWDPSAPERIRQFSTPRLVIHTATRTSGWRCRKGLALFNILQERGVPSRFLNFPDENHWVLKPENSLVWHQQVLGWLNKYSGVGARNPAAVRLEGTTIPVVNYDR
ncbi:putative dipeptidyl-peptidase 5 [Thermoascus aurantiacus ATCC 26904]